MRPVPTSPGPGLLGRVTDRLETDGVRATARRGLQAARDRALISETHVWYRLDLPVAAPGRPLPEGFTFRRATAADVPLYQQLDGATTAGVLSRMDDGAQLWLVQADDGRVAFACWIFDRSTPVSAAVGGQLALPQGVVCLEDSVTSPDFRGRGVAPAAWSSLAQQLAGEGQSTIITKVGEENTASRRAVTKAGFRPFGTMRHRRLLVVRRVEASGDQSPLHRHLLASLPARAGSDPPPVD